MIFPPSLKVFNLNLQRIHKCLSKASFFRSLNITEKKQQYKEKKNSVLLK